MPDLPNIRQLSDLIGRLYDTCLDHRQWQQFLADTTRSFGSGQGLHISISPDAFREGSMHYHGLDMEVVSKWADSKDHVDVWYRALMEASSDTVYRGLDLCSRRELHKSAFYSDTLRALDIEHTLGNFCRETNDHSWAFALFRSKRAGRFTDRQVELFELLTPHFSRAIRIGKCLSIQASKRQALTAALEKSPFGVVVLDSNESVVWSNTRADKLIHSSDGITVRYGQLSLWDYCSQKAVNQAIHQAVLMANHRAIDTCDAIAVPRPSGKSPYQLLVSPANRASECLRSLESAACIILLHDPDQAGTISSATIQRLYDLTKGEARLCVALYKSGSLPDALESLKISRNTAKTHLAHIFEKIGVSNQAQLLQRLTAGLR